LCTPLHLASAYAWTNTPSSVVWLRDQEPGVHGLLSVLGFGHCWSLKKNKEKQYIRAVNRQTIVPHGLAFRLID
jgi:hypothetical protein